MTAGWETRDGRADMTNFEMDLFDTRMSNQIDKDIYDDDDCCKNSIIKPACLPITILAFLLLMTFFVPFFNEESYDSSKYEKTGICTDLCLFRIVESIPNSISYHDQVSFTTYKVWTKLLNNAQHTIDVASFYWNLKNNDNTTSWQGTQIYYNFIKAARRGVKIRIVQNGNNHNLNTDHFIENNIAEVRSVNFVELFGSGFLHTKFWIIDQKHVYIGSADMDWLSLTEIKEIGVEIRNCSCIASDLGKIFTIYWKLGLNGAKIPTRWPIYLRTNFNFKNQLKIRFNSFDSTTFISSSPVSFNPKGREYDLNAIVYLMNNASNFINVSVMDYLPTTINMEEKKNKFWPNIDNAIRSAAYRGVKVNLLISKWKHTKKETEYYLKSLLQINGAFNESRINIKMFIFPSNNNQKQFDNIAMNHNKYMITDSSVYIGTSNWVGDYFITTAGVGFIVKTRTLVEDFKDIFIRDWNSSYSFPLTI